MTRKIIADERTVNFLRIVERELFWENNMESMEIREFNDY